METLMDPFSFLSRLGPDSFFYVIIAVIIASVIWGIASKIEVLFFVRPDGDVKRGIGIGSEPLPFDQENFFRYLPDGVFKDPSGAFIKKANDAVLVQHLPVKNALAIWFERRRFPPCEAYIDLNASQPRIEYRLPFSYIPSFVIGAAFVLWFVGTWPMGLSWGTEALWFPILFSLLILALFAWMAYRDFVGQKKKLLALISEKVQAYSAQRPIRKFW
jgi:hypothetical protein